MSNQFFYRGSVLFDGREEGSGIEFFTPGPSPRGKGPGVRGEVDFLPGGRVAERLVRKSF
jgi:hypothetical protein